MLRCTNEDCRQGFYVTLPIDTEPSLISTIQYVADDAEVTCPICGTKDSGENWKKCGEDPLQFTYMEKDDLCRCGGEIVQNVNSFTAATAARSDSNQYKVSTHQFPRACEDCGAPPGYAFPKIPTLEELKQLRGLNNEE